MTETIPRRSSPRTPRQQEVLRVLRNYRMLHGFAPTLAEIAKSIGTNKVNAREHVIALERDGFVRTTKHAARSIEIIGSDPARRATFPVFGHIGHKRLDCAKPMPDMNLATLFRSTHGVYAIRVRGDWLNYRNLRDGDFIVIERRKTARNGETVLAILASGNAVVAKYYKDGDIARIATPVVITAPVNVQGVVVGMVRGKPL